MFAGLNGLGRAIGLGPLIDRFAPFKTPTPDGPSGVILTALPPGLSPEAEAAKSAPGADRLLAEPLPADPLPEAPGADAGLFPESAAASAAPGADRMLRASVRPRVGPRDRSAPAFAPGVSYATAFSKFKTLVSPTRRGGLDNATVEKIIDQLDPDVYTPAAQASHWFLGLYDHLPRFEVVEEAVEMVNGDPLTVIKKIKFTQDGRTHTTNDTSYVTSGATGFISIGASKRVYKRFRIEAKNIDELDEKVREAFSEAWIQTVLGNDPVYGRHVCQIWGIFRDYHAGALGAGAAASEIAAAVAAGREPSLTIHIIMEPIKYNLKKFLKTRNGGAAVPIEGMIDQYKQLGRLLERFQNVYGFYHRDLHQGNVMFDEGGQIKLIDYGRCCINRIDGKPGTYRSNEYDGQASLAGHFESGFSYDLFMYIVSVLETHGNFYVPPEYDQPTKLLDINHQNELINLLSGRTRSKPDPIHLWDYVKARTEKVRAAPGYDIKKQPDFIFFHTYAWDYVNWNSAGDIPALESLRDNKRLRPTGFLAACMGIKAGGGARRRRQTQRSKRGLRRSRKYRR